MSVYVPTFTGPLAGIRFKIERAKHHIAQLDLAKRIFHQSSPEAVSSKKDPDTGYLVYYVTKVPEVPIDIPAIAGEAINLLRSALDHLAVVLVRAHTPTVSREEIREISFPITEVSKKGMSPEKRRIKGMSPKAIEAIDVIEPHKGGAGHDLYVLHELNNIDKHRMLITAPFVAKGVDGFSFAAHYVGISKKNPEIAQKLKANLLRAEPYLLPFSQDIGPIQDGHVLMADSTENAEPNENIRFAFEVTLHEPPLIERAPVLPTLHKFTSLVEAVVNDLSRFL